MIGRTKEIQRLKEIYNSKKAEFVAVYGRRRVGKTFLINEIFKGKYTFRHTGLSPIEMDDMSVESPKRKQLKAFYNSLILFGMKKSRCPDNWLDAFLMLEMFLESKDTGKRQLVFFDELPWMDTQKSGFVTAFESFWNGWGCYHNNLMVIICGSATSWISDKLINNHGGLYNRLTCELKLYPFSLKECDEFFRSKKVKMSRYDIIQSYMIAGGIPYYLDYFERGNSLAQNVDQLFFANDAYLKYEYDRLFSSVFANPEKIKAIVGFLSTKNIGFTRTEIGQNADGSTGGGLSDALKALQASDFIIRYTPFGEKKEEYYKLVDPFCIFYNRFVKNREELEDTFWQQNVVAPPVNSWRGFAFENVCLNHIGQIKDALGISGVSTKQSVWTKKSDEDGGFQIDLLIERKDNVLNMCEAKYFNKEFIVTKNYYETLVDRQEMLEKNVKRGMVVHNILITTYGLKYNEYSGIFDRVVTLDDLFCS